MKELIIFILSSASLTWIVTRSEMFKRLREYFTLNYGLFQVKEGQKRTFKHYKYWTLHHLTNCYGCFGVWAGLITFFIQKSELHFLLHGLIGTVSSLILISFIKLLDRK